MFKTELMAEPVLPEVGGGVPGHVAQGLGCRNPPQRWGQGPGEARLLGAEALCFDSLAVVMTSTKLILRGDCHFSEGSGTGNIFLV